MDNPFGHWFIQRWLNMVKETPKFRLSLDLYWWFVLLQAIDVLIGSSIFDILTRELMQGYSKPIKSATWICIWPPFIYSRPQFHLYQQPLKLTKIFMSNIIWIIIYKSYYINHSFKILVVDLKIEITFIPNENVSSENLDQIQYDWYFWMNQYIVSVSTNYRSKYLIY